MCTHGGYNGRTRKCHCCILGGVIDPEQVSAYKQWKIDDEEDLITIVQQDRVCVKGEVTDIQRFQTMQDQTKRIRSIFFVLTWLTLGLSVCEATSFMYLYGSMSFLQKGMDFVMENMNVTMEALDIVMQERQIVEPIISDLSARIESADIQSCLEGDLIQNAQDAFVSSLDAWTDGYMEPQIMLNLTQSLTDGTGREDKLSLSP